MTAASRWDRDIKCNFLNSKCLKFVWQKYETCSQPVYDTTVLLRIWQSVRQRHQIQPWRKKKFQRIHIEIDTNMKLVHSLYSCSTYTRTWHQEIETPNAWKYLQLRSASTGQGRCGKNVKLHFPQCANCLIVKFLPSIKDRSHRCSSDSAFSFCFSNSALTMWNRIWMHHSWCKTIDASCQKMFLFLTRSNFEARA